MKKILYKIFNKPTITDAAISVDELTELLREPAPDAAAVLAWYRKNIPANEY